MKRFLPLLFMLFAFVSCKKLNHNEVSVEGYLIAQPNNSPVKGLSLRILDRNSEHRGEYYDYVDGQTDSKGYYKMEYSFSTKADLEFRIPFYYFRLSDPNYSTVLKNKSGTQLINIVGYYFFNLKTTFADTSAIGYPDSIQVAVKNSRDNSVTNRVIQKNDLISAANLNFSLGIYVDYDNEISYKIYRNGNYSTVTKTIKPGNNPKYEINLKY